MLQYLKKITADPKPYIGLHNFGQKNEFSHEKINRCLTDINQCLTDIFKI